ncbi:Hypothetical protein HDN1F_27690 [gamma proteobacterium HdN1]|nr:Hypothetical protein HDN1F_27690 [gamma proteobacterium HdN1]
MFHPEVASVNPCLSSDLRTVARELLVKPLILFAVVGAVFVGALGVGSLPAQQDEAVVRRDGVGDSPLFRQRAMLAWQVDVYVVSTSHQIG